MKPLIIELAENPKEDNLDWSLITYSKELNLSVVAGTKQPAINYLSATTSTFTKTTGESSDSDKGNVNIGPLMGTTTYTANSKEATDSDPLVRGLHKFMATKTITESRETTDSDK